MSKAGIRSERLEVLTLGLPGAIGTHRVGSPVGYG